MQNNKLVEYDTEYITQVDLLLDISHSIKSPRAAWSDMIQIVNKDGNYPGKSSMLFLAMLDIDPAQTTWIYYTMMYVNEHAMIQEGSP